MIERLAQYVAAGTVAEREGPDDMAALARMLPVPGDRSREAAAAGQAVLGAWKLLLRRGQNRTVQDSESEALRRGGLPGSALERLAALLASPPSLAAAREGCGVVQNLVFAPENVPAVAAAGVMDPLLRLVEGRDAATAAAAAGAVQGLVYLAEGRSSCRRARGEAALCRVLAACLSGLGPGGEAGAEDDAVTEFLRRDGGAACLLAVRAAGALRNLSGDPLAAQGMRECGVLSSVRPLLRLPLAQAAASAAGLVQNLAREPRSREALARQPAVMRALVALVSGSEGGAAASAASALMNLLAPAHPSAGAGAAAAGAVPAPDRAAVARLLASLAAAGASLPLFMASDAMGVGARLAGERGSIVELYDDEGAPAAPGLQAGVT